MEATKNPDIIELPEASREEDNNNSFLEESTTGKNTRKMVQCHMCKDEYSETHIEFHLVGVHGVYGPKELYIEPPSPISGPQSGSPADSDAIEPRYYNTSFLEESTQSGSPNSAIFGAHAISLSTQERTSSWLSTHKLEFCRPTLSRIEEIHLGGGNQNLGQDQNIIEPRDNNTSFLEESTTIVKNTTSQMVQCRLCKDEYSETHMEFHLVGVHGVDGPKEMYIEPTTPTEKIDLNRSFFDLEELYREYNTSKETSIFLYR